VYVFIPDRKLLRVTGLSLTMVGGPVVSFDTVGVAPKEGAGVGTSKDNDGLGVVGSGVRSLENVLKMGMNICEFCLVTVMLDQQT